MAEELTGLQQQLLGALLESGLSKDVLLRACDALYARQAEITESADRAAASNAQHKEKPELCRDLQQTTPGRTDAPKIEEAPKRIVTQETRMEAEQQINFLDQMLRMDPWQAAKIIKLYMQQHNIPQREVVESTGLNQSHLSQHLNKGTPMKTNKRAALYTWFENKRKEVVEQYNSPGKRQLSEIESSGGSPSKKSRRNRFKWGPASTNILYQSYEDQKNPSKDEREALVEACNRAECNQRGVPFDNVEGLGPNLVTESRVYNWFANRRKEETFRLKLAIDAANYPETPITAAQGPVTVTRPLGSPTVHTVMSPVIPCATPTTAVPSMAKPSLPQPGPVDPVTRQQLQQPLLGSSHIGHGQQTAGAHPSQHQGLSTVMGNFVPAVPPPQMPLNIAMMPPPGVPVPTCQVAVQPEMMPASSMGHHQHPVVPGIGQMPVLVSMQPGIDGLPHGMPQLPENVSQIAGAPQLVQMHPVPMTTLPMPPPLQPITCSDIPLPPSLQPISVMSPMVQLPQQPPVPVSIPPNSGNLSGNVNQPQSPIYEVKLDTSVKDVVIEKKDVVTCINTTSIKTKEDVKCGGLKVENGDDDTIIAENVTITTESEEQSREGSKPSYDVKKENRCSKPIQSPSADDSSCCQSVNKPNGES